MNILVIGQNGREHALAVTYAKSPKVKKVVMTPGNGLTDYNPSTGSTSSLQAGSRFDSARRAGQAKIKNYPEVGMMDFDAIVKVCKKENIDLVDVGQDDIIAAGYVDKFTTLGIKAFGPTQEASEIEWDKEWARNFMKKYNLPIPIYESFSDQSKALAYIEKLPEQLLFIKASGLAMGKGVIRADTKEEAKEAIIAMSTFGKSGETFLIEEGLVGEEFTLFAICDGDNYVITKSSQDHKTVYDGDKGPNTGGVGSVAPTSALTTLMIQIIRAKIIKPTIEGMKKEGRPYSGILYLGGIITTNGIRIIEFNARWGDPEAEVILPSIQTDYVDIVKAVIEKKLSTQKIDFDNKVRISIAGCSKGYPENYSAVKGKEIFGLTEAMKLPDITIFGAGIKRDGKRFFVNGGRVFHVIAEGENIIDARKKAYEAMSLISIYGDNLHYRTDIGWRDVERLRLSS